MEKAWENGGIIGFFTMDNKPVRFSRWQLAPAYLPD